MFDWLNFLNQYNISFVTAGHSVSKGNVAVRCPWCSSEDPSTHMGISLDGKGWGCWRRADHRGRNPARLVQALLGCSQDRAREIVGYSDKLIGDDFLAQVMGRLSAAVEPVKVGKLVLPDEFKPIKPLPSAKPYIAYLKRRGFDPLALGDYDLRYCTRGPYHGRIIFPIYYRGELMTWSGRSIYPTEGQRYKVLSTKPERAAIEGYGLARASSNHLLLFYDMLVKSSADTLFVCEGPFDALKVMWLGRDSGIVATCLFTNSPTMEQVDLLYDLVPRFKRRYLLLDRDMFYVAIKTSSSLTGLELDPVMLPPGVKDPGELTAQSFAELSARRLEL